tara:strand:- start:12930 stop:13838 length:909 start_codon:yes stop_codon:yes gene_type:complete
MGYSVSLTQMSYFVALEKFRNFARAAEECSVSQPTLSSQINKMEETLGAVLINRSHKPLKLTQVGKNVFYQIKRILHEADELYSAIEDLKNPLSGILKLGWMSFDQPQWLTDTLIYFKEFNPEVSIEIIDVNPNSLSQDLLNYDCDIIISSNYQKPSDNLNNQLLFNENICLFHFTSNDLIEFQKINARDLIGSRNSIITANKQLSLKLYEAGLQSEVQQVLLPEGHWSSAISAGRRGLGVVLLPESESSRLDKKEKQSLKIFEFENYSFQWIISFSSKNNLIVRAFIEKMRDFHNAYRIFS